MARHSESNTSRDGVRELGMLGQGLVILGLGLEEVMLLVLMLPLMGYLIMIAKAKAPFG